MIFIFEKTFMKHFLLLLFAATSLSTIILAQPTALIPPLDKSPMDMSTYPSGYPMLKIQDKATEPLIARVVYSRPQKNGRIIFGDLLAYNEVWRFGANENTEIEFFKDVKINNSSVKKGKYSLFAIPNTDKWTIIFNKDLNSWGSFKYQSSKDLLRVNLPVQKMPEIAETFFIYFEKSGKGFSMVAGWDDVEIILPISM
jgi:Protein of unknown function (DUF2911)